MTGLRTVGGGLISPYTVTTNRVINPNFRVSSPYAEVRRNYAIDPAATKNTVPQGAIGWAPSWYGSAGSGTTTTLTGITGPVPEITTAMRKTWTVGSGSGDTGFIHANKGTAAGFPVTPGQVITASSYIRANASTNKNSYMRAFFYDANNNQLSYINGGGSNGNSVVLTSSWQRVYLTFTVPDNCVAVAIWSEVTGGAFVAGDTADGTGLLVEKSYRVGTYFDGSTPSVNGQNFVWSGTTNNSNPVMQGQTPKYYIIAKTKSYALEGGGVLIRPDEVTTSTDTYICPEGDSGALRLGMQPGKTYTVSADGVALAADSGESGTRGRRIVMFQKVNGAYIEKASSPVNVGTIATRVSVTWTIDPTATEAFVRLYNGSYLRDVVWSRLSMVEGTDASYIDGDQPQDALNAYRWTGAADTTMSEKITTKPLSIFKPDGSDFVTMQKVLPRKNWFLNQDFANVTGGIVEVRRNLVSDPRATASVGVSGVTMGWQSRWFGGSGNGTNTYVTGANDGPTILGSSITTYMRKTWTAGPTANTDTGFQFSGSSTTTSGYPVTPGQVYTVSAYLRPSASGKHCRMAVTYYNSSGTAVGSQNQYEAGDQNAILPANVWTRVKGTFAPVPAGAAYALFIAYIGYSASDTVLWQPGDTLDGTAALIELNGTLSPYFDGATAAANSLVYSWTGTANASASIATGKVLNGGFGPVRALAYQYAPGSNGTGYAARAYITDANNVPLAQRYTFAITPVVSQPYSFSAMMRYSQPGGFILAIQWVDSLNNVISTPTSTPVTGVPANTWTYVKFENVIAPPGATKGQVWFGLNNGAVVNEFFDIDHIITEQAPSVGPFFSGSTPNDADYVYAFVGAADSNTMSTATP